MRTSCGSPLAIASSIWSLLARPFVLQSDIRMRQGKNRNAACQDHNYIHRLAFTMRDSCMSPSPHALKASSLIICFHFPPPLGFVLVLIVFFYFLLLLFFLFLLGHAHCGPGRTPFGYQVYPGAPVVSEQQQRRRRRWRGQKVKVLMGRLLLLLLAAAALARSAF